MPLTAEAYVAFPKPHKQTLLTTHQSNGSSDHAGRNTDGTFTKGSNLAKELGAQGGHAAHEHQTAADDGVSITL